MHEILKDLSQWLCLGDNSGFETSGIDLRQLVIYEIHVLHDLMEWNPNEILRT